MRAILAAVALFVVAAFVGEPLLMAQVDQNKVNISTNSPGVLPTVDGRALNLDFETGDLTDWTATGKAWEQQPHKGLISPDRPYGGDKKSFHTGDYWIGGYEFLGDGPMGTLTSVPFAVSERWASFLLGGGAHAQTRVELWEKDAEKPFYKIHGKNLEDMDPVVVDLNAKLGKEIFVRIIDEHTGGWGHVNFDDFRLHKVKPKFRRTVSKPPTATIAAKQYPYQNLTGAEAAAVMQVPAGFKVQLAAAEPDVTQPIAMAIDDRGRVWIAEGHTYPNRAKPGEGKDRILIFEDTNQDGVLDKRKVFIEGLNLVSGIELGFGGVWVGAAPYLMFIPDRDGDDIPDGEGAEPFGPSGDAKTAVAHPEDVPTGATVLLDGWAYQDTHETLNAFIWGPDGWLYGCHGVFTHSRVGKPGTPDDQRTPINAGVWRYHPVNHEFEVFAHGSSNPWGVDFDRYGEAFITACVIPHLYHVIPNARYQRQAGQHFNPHTYDDIKTIARHRHFVGNQWNNNDRLASDDLGGGHAHAGAMIYQGGAWPKEYEGKLFMNNIHGNRINVDQLIPEGSGFAGDRSEDFLLTGDAWSQMIYMTYGPDGQVWAIDWYDQNQCHHNDAAKHDRGNGRIYRISYNDAQPVKVDLKKKTDRELLELAMLSKNEWYARHARRLLHERRADGRITDADVKSLEAEFDKLSLGDDLTIDLLRSLWIVNVLESPDKIQKDLLGTSIDDALEVPAEFRAWVVRLISESSALRPETYGRRVELAKMEPSPRVRLAMAAALQDMPLDQRWEILEGLTSHAEDASDHNLPLMYWYAMEPLADVDPQRALALAMAAGENIPILREFMIRRLGSGDPKAGIELLTKGLAEAEEDSVRLTFLKGIRSAVKGQKEIVAPSGWDAIYQELSEPNTTAQNFDVYLYTLGLGAKFGNQEAQTRLREIAVDEAGAYEERKVVFRFLVEARDPQLKNIVKQLLHGTTLRTEALRAAAAIDDDSIPDSILDVYSSLNQQEQFDARATLASRAKWATTMLAAVQNQRIAKKDLSADLIRQMRNLNDEAVTKSLESVWGVVRESDADRKALMAKLSAMLHSPPQHAVEIELGRSVFMKTCQQCHTLFGTGGKIGPDITGANRRDLNYLLSNIVDPSAVMAKEYQPAVLATESGRIITGIVKSENDYVLTVQTANELLELPAGAIEAKKQSDKSMMPDDLLKNLSEVEVRALVAYLQSPGQVAVAATDDNVKAFFNGKDLSGWRASREVDEPVWTIQDGEIIGKTDGLKHNSFLVSDYSLADFRFTVEVKLTPNNANSGIQFRSIPLASGEMRGYQADMGDGWWGKLYEESARGLLEKSDAAEESVRQGDWNRYEIIAVGDRVSAWLNGTLAFDRVDPEGARKGQIALQVHSGGATEVRFRNLKIELLDAVPSFATSGARPGTWPVSPPLEAGQKIRWKKTVLDDLFRSEGCCIVDYNHDGRRDIVAGPMLYSQIVKRDENGIPSSTEWVPSSINPELKQEYDPKGYSNSFMNFADDINGDGWPDIVEVDFPGNQTWWFENPRNRRDPDGPFDSWKKHEITPVTNNESPQFLDILGNGERSLLAGFKDGIMGFATRQSHPQALWKVNAVSSTGAPETARFSHGIGAGDINGDGHNDIVCTKGWWEHPGVSDDGKTLASAAEWTFHLAPLGKPCSQMYVFDFDGDGDADVLSTSAHQFGMWWHEQQPPTGVEANSESTWTTHEIDMSFSQTHALVLADLNGDGLPDFVTGKRHWAHGGHDPGGKDPAVVYWYEFSRDGKTPKWTKHQIDDNSGIGTQFDVADINGDGLLDIATSNKQGTFIFEQIRE